MMDSATAPVGGSVSPVPAGPHHVVCVDGINLGMRVEENEKGRKKLTPKYAFVFQSSRLNPDTNERFLIVREFTLSMNDRGNLRKFVEGWLGTRMSDEQAESFNLAALYRRNGIGTVIQKEKQSGGGSYAQLTSITGLMEGMPTIEPHGYTRPEYLLERKAEYAKAAQEFAAKEALHAQSASLIPAMGAPSAVGSATASTPPAASAMQGATSGVSAELTLTQAKQMMVQGKPLQDRTNQELELLLNWANTKGNAVMARAADLLLTERTNAAAQDEMFGEGGPLADGDDDLPF